MPATSPRPQHGPSPAGTHAATGSAGLVPLADRMRHLVRFRAAAVVLVAVHAVLLGGRWEVPPGPAVAGAAAYVLLSWLPLRWADGVLRRRLPAFGATLLADGVLLAVLVQVTGWLASPLRYLLVLHVIVVTLAASYRTGTKVVVWHALMLLVLAEARAVGLLGDVPAGDGLEGPMWLVGAMVAVVGVTSAASAVNERELRRNRFDLDALARMAARFEIAAAPQVTAQIAVESIAGTFDVHRVLLVTAHEGTWSLLASHGVDVIPSDDATPDGVALLHRAAGGAHPVLVRGLDRDAEPWLAALLPDATDLSVMPLVAEGTTIGALVVEHDLGAGSRLERRTLEILSRFVAHIGLALANAFLSQRLTEIAELDGLTGLRNRRAFDEALARSLAQAAREGREAALLLLDLDHFKALNDTHGHVVGDDVLRGVGMVLRQQSRAVDVPARYGGEEFAVILPGADLPTAAAVGERIRRALADAPTPVPVSASIGAAVAQPGETAADLVRRADRALYAAKDGGRDRVATDVPVPNHT